MGSEMCIRDSIHNEPFADIDDAGMDYDSDDDSDYDSDTSSEADDDDYNDSVQGVDGDTGNRSIGQQMTEAPNAYTNTRRAPLDPPMR